MPPPSRYSLAVLSFEVLSRDTADAYLSDGFADGIATQLGTVGRLEVKRPRGSSVRTLLERGTDHAAILGRALRVRYLVEGSVQRGGAQVRVSVRLVRTEGGGQAWARSYDRSATDPLAAEAEIAEDVAREVAGQLLPAERQRFRERASDPRAEEHFRRGTYLMGRRSGALLAAIAQFDAALALQPDHVPALAMSAYAHALAVWWGVMVRDSGLPRGFALAERAMRLDSGSSIAWMGRAMLLSVENPLDQRPAEAAMARAVALDPRNDEAWHQRAQLLGYLGRFADADSAITRALELDPSRAISLVYRSELRTIARDFSGARRALDSVIVLEPGLLFAYPARARSSLALGDSAAARRDLARALAAGYDRFDARLLKDLLDGDTAAVRGATSRELMRLARAGPADLMDLAAVCALSGDRDAILRILGIVPAGHLRWYGARFWYFDHYRSDPVLGPLLEAGRPGA